MPFISPQIRRATVAIPDGNTRSVVRSNSRRLHHRACRISRISSAVTPCSRGASRAHCAEKNTSKFRTVSPQMRVLPARLLMHRPRQRQAQPKLLQQLPLRGLQIAFAGLHLAAGRHPELKRRTLQLRGKPDQQHISSRIKQKRTRADRRNRSSGKLSEPRPPHASPETPAASESAPARAPQTYRRTARPSPRESARWSANTSRLSSVNLPPSKCVTVPPASSTNR